MVFLFLPLLVFVPFLLLLRLTISIFMFFLREKGMNHEDDVDTRPQTTFRFFTATSPGAGVVITVPAANR